MQRLSPLGQRASCTCSINWRSHKSRIQWWCARRGIKFMSGLSSSFVSTVEAQCWDSWMPPQRPSWTSTCTRIPKKKFTLKKKEKKKNVKMFFSKSFQWLDWRLLDWIKIFESQETCLLLPCASAKLGQIYAYVFSAPCETPWYHARQGQGRPLIRMKSKASKLPLLHESAQQVS